MIQTGFESRIKVQDIIESQIPEFILDENPNASEFLKQYYSSQEYQSGPVDIIENLDQYLKLDNLTPDVVVGFTSLPSSSPTFSGITSTDTTIKVVSTKGFPQKYGLLKIDDEIITYTGITTNSFTGCIRGFSGVTSYNKDLNSEELVFSESDAKSHTPSTAVQNLSVLFLQEFYKKVKYSLAPGFENLSFVSDLNVGNFIKEARTFYKSKGTSESFRILFNVLFGETPKVVDLEQFLIKPSSASYVRGELVIAEAISGDPLNLQGQIITKSTDPRTTASVSEVESITRKGKKYYKLLLFVGYDDSFPTITGEFSITGSTKNLDTVSIGSSVITVDSTIGFPKSGTIYSGDNVITYTKKSINQFFGCSGVSSEIPVNSVIRSNDTYYGYENGDITKKVEFRLVGVLSDYSTISQEYAIDVNDQIGVKNIGEYIKKSSSNPSYKEIFANSWIYNTSSRYQIQEFNTISQFTLNGEIDDSSLKVGDFIDILSRDSQTVFASNLLVSEISGNQVSVFPAYSIENTNLEYDIRRKVKYSSSSIVPLEFNNTLSDVQNVYNENDEFMYVASNSLPSYQITKSVFSYNALSVSDSVITFVSPVSFKTGDEIYYSYSELPIPGLSTGYYYVEVIPSQRNRKIKLYLSRNLIGSNSYITLGDITEGTHNFILRSQKENLLSPQRILRKFPLTVNNGDGKSDLTDPGSVGMLVNGVEIFNYKSTDKVYYGPLKSVDVLSGGKDYDVIRPPQLTISTGSALVQPILSGSIEKVYVEPQDFDIDVRVSIALSGGNGKGASFQPVIEKRRREIEFDAREIIYGGGVDITNETITFRTRHGLVNGESLIYRPGNSPSLGIGTYKANNFDTGETLKSESTYYIKCINDKTVELYQTFSDYISGINTVGFTTVGTSGIQKFATQEKNTLSEIKVINGGSGYQNRKLRVLPVGINTINSTINFTNHGFNSGELVVYSYQNSGISGLVTTNQYYVIKVDDDSFRLANAGIGGTYVTDYARGKTVKLSSSGSGYQIFNYPDISLNVEYSLVGVNTVQVRGKINAIPVVKGEIIDTYTYAEGVDYGSKVLNQIFKPSISVKTGKFAQLKPIILGGKIIDVSIQSSGSEYYSTPNLKVTGDGVGAILYPTIVNNRIVDVKIINGGSGYSSENTSITVEPSGKGAIFNPQIRSLTLNNNFLYGEYDDLSGTTLTTSEIVRNNYTNNLQYTISSYSRSIRDIFGDSDSSTHSPIIGWAYDGNPIYGSYGYSDPSDKNSRVRRIISGYELNSSNVSNRPVGFDPGYFVEDYKFVGSGDLDEYNGRFCVTPEFPNGVYAYFATIENNSTESFPYFIGNRYRSKFVSENKKLTQEFDFNNSSLVRNTFPYKVNDTYSSNDFITNTKQVKNQLLAVESTTIGSIDDVNIINSGDFYKVGDSLEFDETNAKGGGFISEVSEVNGKNIVNLQTTSIEYNNSLFTWSHSQSIRVKVYPNHNLSNLDYVNVSGFSSDLTQLNGFYQIGVTSYTSALIADVPNYATTGLVTDIYVSSVPENISIGSSIKIKNESFSILNIFNNQNVLRVSRETSGVAHTATTIINFIPDSFTINKPVDYFDSTDNDLVYFNPKQSIGVGLTVGIGISNNYTIGSQIKNISIPTQSIYLPNHPFKNNQQITLIKPSGSSSISVANTSGDTPFSLPLSGDEQTVYVIRQSSDYIGIVTQIGITTTSNGLLFLTNGTDDFSYLFKSNKNQITGNIQKITSKIYTEDPHELSDGDQIKLTVNPNTSVGIGTSTSVKVKFDSLKNKLLLNEVTFTSSGISTNTNQISITNHGFETGDKVLYSADSTAGGLSYGDYHVFKIDDNTIYLCETLIDSLTNPPLVVDIISSASSNNKLSLINPQINCVNNNNLVFDLSDSSLLDYKFKLFYDKDFVDEFVSTGSTSIFSTSFTGTVGTANASITIRNNGDINLPLFYCLEKSGIVITSDNEVKNHSQINFINSFYNGSYKVSGVGTTSFNISLQSQPETEFYNQQTCDLLKYTTSSKEASGGVSKVRIISPGSGYDKLPIFKKVNSSEGNGAFIVPVSNNIGNINQFRIINEEFEYPSDKTLRPESFVPTKVTLKNSNTISQIRVSNGGKNYITAPNLIITDSVTNEKINSGDIKANLLNSSIQSVSVLIPPKGLPESTVNIVATNNSNGIRIQSVTSSPSGIVTCTLVTPENGFTIEPFASNDKIFVEGITIVPDSGKGLNSEDHGYKFFTIDQYLNSGTANNRVIVFNISSSVGIASDTQDFNASIVNYKNYPKFVAVQEFSKFITGELLEVNSSVGFIGENVFVVDFDDTSIKVSGTYELKSGDIIRGTLSGSTATVESLQKSTGRFTVGYGLKQRKGWTDNIGKLNDDFQVIPNNDYYQNLSYTIKSKQEWENIVSPVNNLVHISGLKNFADTEILKNANVGIITSVLGPDGEDLISSVYDLASENRVDTINNFTLAKDIDTIEDTSKYLKLNRNLSDYLQAETNRVLIIDDIRKKFFTYNLDPTFNIVQIDPTRKYERYLIQVTSGDSIQFTELIILSTNNDTFTYQRAILTNDKLPVSDIFAGEDGCNDGNNYLRFIPSDSNNFYDIKYLNTSFLRPLAGLGTYSIGFTNLSGLSSSVSVGSTLTLFERSISSVESVYSEINIIDSNTQEMNYVELFVTHDENEAFISELYSDTLRDDLNSNFIGSFGASVSGGVLKLNYENNSLNPVTIKIRNVGFGSTSLGIGTYRFKLNEQTDGSERTVKYESLYTNSSSTSSIISFDTSLGASLKSTIKVGIGSTCALHQVMLITDGTDIYTLQYPFLSLGTTSGIGTFGGEISGTTASLVFYPDPEFTGNFEVLSFNQFFYKENDYVNIPPILSYGSVTEAVGANRYYPINTNDLTEIDDSNYNNQTIFDLTYKEIPIYAKWFNPSDSNILDLSDSEFNIPNHFFSTGEELNYKSKSTFAGIEASPVGIAATLNNVGILTDIMPSTVYAIKINNDRFKIASRREYALANPPIPVSITNVGAGNSHLFEMAKRNEKSLIALDNIVQYPIAYSLLDYQVDNGGQINTSSTIIGLSGISSINLGDILKIDNEYMKVLNVGLGTQYGGPISFAGTFPLVSVKRGFLGSLPGIHSDFSNASLYRGSFNIVESKIYFTDPPKGANNCDETNLRGIDPEKAYFNGRTFLKKDYTTNKVYDNINESFTGIGKTYTLTVGGANTVGLGLTYGSGVVFINGIFQTPSTDNNPSGNFSIEEDLISGISTLVFSGNNISYISDTDINENQLPRGGMIVSLGSTPGLGYAPLVGASVTATVSGGSIVDIGIGTTGNWGSGYRNPVSVKVFEEGHSSTEAVINAEVGIGGTLSFTISNPGRGYINPTIIVSPPSYSNLPVIGVSRSGVSTTDTGVGLLLNVEVGPVSTTGIGSTLFEVKQFEIARNGYNFKKGDVIEAVGLVTAFELPEVISKFQLTVLETFNDTFGAWEFGQLDYIDSIKKYQDGSRTRFPLYYNSELLSFGRNPSNPDSQLIDFNALLIIFVNGVLQKPIESYQFNGGTSFTFTLPPKPDDIVDVFFYKGGNDDSSIRIVNEIIKVGDSVQVFSNNNLLGVTTTQNSRTVYDIISADVIETNVYREQGIDIENEKPLYWTKQKVDKIINEEVVSKSRDSLEPQVYPTAKIISDLSLSDTQLFVDDAEFFNYENEVSIDFDGLIISGQLDAVSAAVTAVVSASGTIQSLTISNVGSGYTGASVNLKISAPSSIGVGLGATALASIGVVGGSLSPSLITITNPGFGYTYSRPPQVIAPLPSPVYENITNITEIEGFSGKIVGIEESVGIGTDLALKFVLDPTLVLVGSGLSIGNPIYIFDTSVGLGVTSIIDSDSSIVGVGTTFLDNVYNISDIDLAQGHIICNVHSDSNIVGIATTGSIVGRFSWGRLSGFTRSSSPISIGVSGYTVNSGLTTYPTIQRRGYGLRNNGSLQKIL